MVLAGPGRAGQDAWTPLRSDRGKDLALRAVGAGGLGAMAAALVLARTGIDVQVFEQAQQLTEASADVSLAPNRLRMLKRFGSARGSGEWPHGTGRPSCCSPAGCPGTSLTSS